MPNSPRRLRAAAPAARPTGVDRANNVILGYTVAQVGPFKSAGRGEFDLRSLRTIVQLGNEMEKGLKVRYTHPTDSDDSLGKFLGRATKFRLAEARNAAGKKVDAVRADLKFDPTALDTPPGGGGKPLGRYVMDLAESDPDAISSSLVLDPDQEARLDHRTGLPLVGPDGEELPPLWRPKKLFASDIVDEGDAVDGLLSAEGLCRALSADTLTDELRAVLKFDNLQRLSTQLLDGFFKGAPREEVEEKCKAWLARYLDLRHGGKGPAAEPEPQPAGTPRLDAVRLRLDRIALACREMRLDKP